MATLTASKVVHSVAPNAVLQYPRCSHWLNPFSGKVAALQVAKDTIHGPIVFRHIYHRIDGGNAGTFSSLRDACRNTLVSGDRIFGILMDKNPKTNASVPTGTVFEMEYIGSSDLGEPMFVIRSVITN